jgi:predicted permease
LFRAILRLFPREFRGDFGDQMLDDFREQREHAVREGRHSSRRLWRRTVTDALRSAPREHLDILRRDAGYAMRLFLRRPGMTASALLTLAIGIGLNAAVFSVAHAVLWRSLPLPDSERIVSLHEVSPAPERQLTRVSPDNATDWAQSTRRLEALATVSSANVRIISDTGAEQIPGLAVSRGFMEVMRPRLQLGRLFTDHDYAAVRAQVTNRDRKQPRRSLLPGVAIISHALWQRQLGGRPDVIGQRVPIGSLGVVEIVGVLEPAFVFPLEPEVECWLPDVPDGGGRRARYLRALGRLAPGVTVEEAQAEFDVIAGRLETQYPAANKGRGARVTLLRHDLSTGIRQQLWFLAGAALCVLLIAGANVSNLLLTHISGRRRELAARVALGAGPGRLIRQALTEGLLLAFGGGLLGLALAVAAVPVLVSIAPANIPRLDEVTVGWQVLVFAAGISLAAGIASGASASVVARRRAIDMPLRATGAAGWAYGRRLRLALIIGEIAVALMLAVAAGLLVKTMRAVGELPLGFDPANVISIGLSPDTRRLRDPRGKALEADLVARIRLVPGVVAAGIGSRPLGGGGMGTTIRVPDATQSSVISADAVGPGYLEALGARIVAGRFIESQDDERGQKVGVMNEAAARVFFNGDAVSRTVLNDRTPILIVGVLADVRRSSLEDDPEPTMYLASSQTAMFWTNNILVRASDDPKQLLPAIRTVVKQVDPELPLTRIQTLEEALDTALAPRRFLLQLVTLFSITALGLAVVGIYGVVMESVAQRVLEIGVRMALGATPRGIVTMVLAQSAGMIGLGLLLGGAASLALNGVMRSFVFRVPTTDPASYVAAGIALALATIVACSVPARRAARIDPVAALRQE